MPVASSGHKEAESLQLSGELLECCPYTRTESDRLRCAPTRLVGSRMFERLERQMH